VLRQVSELDDSDPWAHLALGYAALSRRRTDEAVEEFQRALDLNPNFAIAHGYLAMALALDGRSEKAIAHAEQAIHMSPHDPQNAIFNMSIAVAHYLADRYPGQSHLDAKPYNSVHNLLRVIGFTSRAWRKPVKSRKLAKRWRE
jgi:tetratricopeptide (TPR) repeat protein